MWRPFAFFYRWLGGTKLPVEPIPIPEYKPVKILPVKPVIMANKWKDVTIQGSEFPDPYKIVPVKLNDTIKNEYLPAMERALPAASKGLKLLITVQASAEGFYGGAKPSRSYRTNNPGNLSNTDSGSNKGFKSLEDGIRAQAVQIQKIVDGKSKAYPMGKSVNIAPFFSKEIQNNLKNYGAESGYVPGYKFVFNGEISAYLKIYATAARFSNNYVNQIVSYFKINGLEINPNSRLQDIIKM